MVEEIMMQKDGEDRIAWMIRCCLAKKRRQTSMDWVEIRDMLELTINPDELRKEAAGMLLMDNYYHTPDGSCTKILSISDAHVPFNLPVNIFSQYAGCVDILVFNGDIEDCFSCSSFSKKYRVPLDDEMVASRKYLIDVIELVQPKEVFIVMGNHEYRLGRYLTDRLSDSIMAIMPDSPMELIVNSGFKVKNRELGEEVYYSPISDLFRERGINIHYTGDWKCKIGHTLFVHPLAYSSGMLKTTEKAVNFFLREDRDFNAIVMAHTHKIGSYTQGSIKMFEQGCCCDLRKLDYNNGKLVIPGQEGFIYICQDENGDIIDDKTKIIAL